MSTQTIKLRHDTAARWVIVNPVLEVGEFGVESDTGRFKIGDDLLAWNDLPYRGESGGGLAAINVSAGATSESLSALTFQNSNGVSFGLDAGVITASVIPGGGGGGSVNLSAGTTNNSGTAFSFANSNGVSFGLNASTVTATVRTDYQSAGNYLTTAALSQDSSKYAGTNGALTGGSITLNTSGLSISLPAYLTTAMQSNAATISNAKLSAGTLSAFRSDVTFGDSNGVSFGLNTNGVLTGTVATNYQSQGAYLTTAALSADSSKYAGTNGAITGGSITVNTAGVSVNLPAYLTTAMQSNAATISNIKISAGALSAFRSAVTFGDTNGVSFGLETNGVLTATVATNYQSAGAYLTTAALSQDSSKYAGTNGAITGGSITVNTAGVSVNLPAYLTTAALSQDSSNYVQEWALTGNTAGTTSSAQGTRLYFSGGNGLTISGSSNSIVFAVGNYLTTAALSADSSKYAGTNGAITGGSITVNTSGVSINLPAYLTTAALSADSSKYAGINGAITGGSITVNTSGVSVNLPAYLTTAGLSADSSKYVQEWALTGNTAGTTSSAQGTRLYLSGGQGITISGNTNSLVFSVGSYITTGALSADSSKYAGTNGAITGGSITVNTAGVSVNLPAYLTTAALSADSSKYAGINGAITGGSITVNTSGVSVNLPAYLTTAMQSNAATISNINVSVVGSAADLSNIVFSNSNNVTFGLNGSTITVSIPSASVITLSVVGSSQTFGNVVFSNSNRVTFGLNGSTVTAQHALNFSAGSTSTNVSDQIVFSNSNGYSFGLNSSTITMQGPSVGYLEPYAQSNTAGLAPVAGSWYLAPFVAPNSMSGGRINFLQINSSTAGLFRDITGGSYVSSSSGGKNQSGTFSLGVALWSQGSGTNSTRLESLWSNSFSWGWSHRVLVSQSAAASNVSVTVSQSISYISEIGSNGAYTLNQFASNNNSAGTNTSMASAALDSVGVSLRNMLSNSVMVPVGFNTTISAGNYWLGVAWSTTTASATSQTSFAGASALWFSQLSLVGISRLELNSLFRNWGSTATTARSQLVPTGAYTAAANMTPPQFIALSSDIASVASQWIPYFNFVNQGITK